MRSKNVFAGSALMMVLLGGWFVERAPGVSIDVVGQTRVVPVSISARDGKVSGEIVNNLAHQVRDVQLLIRHVWHWNDEFRPGSDNPGKAVYYTVEKVIPPGGKVPFTYEADGLPKRADGHFETIVSVAGYTEVIQP